MTASEDEHKRLREFYSDLTDGELENIAEDSTSLTEAAREELSRELKTRDLGNLQKTKIEIDSEPGLRKLVTIKRFANLLDASLAKGLLQSSGIECFLPDENMLRVYWGISNSMGGVRLQVNIEDAEESLAILNQPTPKGSEDE
ncbi:MAG: DUF2007 domain-containing protein [Acidobacteriaceae bacterium]